MWWDSWELQDGSAPSPSQGTAQQRAFHTRNFFSDCPPLPGESLQLQEPVLGCGQDGDPGAPFGREERTVLIPPSPCRDTFVSPSGTSSPVFLPALLLLLLGLWGGLVYPNLLQFVNLPAPGQPHLQQQSLGNGSNEPPDQIRFLFLTSRETWESWWWNGREGGVAPSADHREEQGESARADPCFPLLPRGGFLRMLQLQPQRPSTASQALPDLPNPA